MWTTQKHVPRWDLPAGLAGAQLGVKTPLPIHEGASRHMAVTLWFGCDNRKSRIRSVSISHVSVELYMRLRLVSVVGEFLWSCERLVHHDVQCFPGGH